MIVVAIIGILAAIAIPAYQNYIARSQATSALAEITPGKTQYEVLLNDDRGADVATVTNLGLQATTERCDITATAPDATGAAAPAIECTIKGTPKVKDKVVSWDRTAEGVWSCSTDLDAEFAPKGCS